MQGYRPEIDGLRTVAVVPVVLFHAGYSFFSGGYVGVDVFFVISGYLITGILMRDLADGRFSLLRFYERRARRILPALFVVMLASLAVATIWLPPEDMRVFARSVVAVVFFASNIFFWRTTGYFDGNAEERVLLHTWSLAVEEQFYLFFPLLLFALWRFGPRMLMAAFVALALLSLGLSEWGWRNEPGANFYLLPTRAWELLAGSICALVERRRALPAPAMPGIIGLAMIVASILAYDASTPFPSVFALLPVGGTVLVILFARPGTPAGRLLSTGPMVGIGLVSYSAYLWHQPLFAFARHLSYYAPAPATMGALTVLTFLLAWATWRWVEAPFRKGSRARPLTRAHIFAASAAASVAFAAVGIAGHVTDGRRALWEAMRSPEMAALDRRLADVREGHRTQADGVHDDGACVFDVREIDDAAAARIAGCADAHGPGVMILGDSHAIDLYGMAVHGTGPSDFLVGLVSGGCRPHDPMPGCPYDDLEAMVRDRPGLIDVIVYEQAGLYLLASSEHPGGGRQIFQDEDLPRLTPLEDRIDLVARYLDRLAVSVPVVWLGPRIEPHIPFEMVRKAGCDYGYRLRPGTREAFDALDAAIAARTSRTAVSFLPQSPLLNLQFPADFLDCGAVYWSDGDHLSREGEARFAPRLDIAARARRLVGPRED